MPKYIRKPMFIKTRDVNGNYVTLNMTTGRTKIDQSTKQHTSINKPQRKQNIKRTIKSGEKVFTDWRTGKKTVFTPRYAEVKSDNRSEFQKQEDQKVADILHQKYEQEKTTQEGLKNLEAIGKVVSPSTYLGPLANKTVKSIQGDKQDQRSIGQQILSGEGTGSASGNLLLDFAGPYLFSKLPKIVNSINRFLLPKPNLYYSNNTLQLNPNDLFKSELDWSPQSWFSKRADKKWTKQDEDALASHLKEYFDIERKSKQNGTWLKNEDGSTWVGDPRSWVQMQSNLFKKNYNNEVLTHGENAINDFFGDFYDDGVGAGIGDKVLWTSTNKQLGKTYGNDVFSLAASKNAKTTVVANAEGRPWLSVIPGKDTDSLVYPNLTNDNIVRINNVVDAGPNIKWNEIKDFRQNETVPEYLSRKYTGDDVVIGEDVSRKSIIGNNGDFNPIDKNIYRALAPFIIGSGAYGVSDYNSGKDARIKKPRRKH